MFDLSFFQGFLAYLVTDLGWLGAVEFAATIFGVVSVWLTIKEKIWCWPIGLLWAGSYIAIFYQAKLYSDVGLQVVYVGLQFYGWYIWLYGGANKTELKVSRIKASHAMIWAAVAAGAIVGEGLLMSHYTDAALPFWDAATTVLSLIAQLLMVKKIYESWVVWIVVDVIATGVYITKDLYATSVLYAFFCVLAISGLLAWNKSLKDHSRPHGEPA